MDCMNILMYVYTDLELCVWSMNPINTAEESAMHTECMLSGKPGVGLFSVIVYDAILM